MVHNYGASLITPPSYIRVRAIVWACSRGQTDRHTDARHHKYISRRLRLTRSVITNGIEIGRRRHDMQKVLHVLDGGSRYEFLLCTVLGRFAVCYGTVFLSVCLSVCNAGGQTVG